MAVPKAAQEQLERAEQLHREMYGDPDTPAEAEAQDEPTEPERTQEEENDPPVSTEPDEDAGDSDDDDLREQYRKLDSAYKTLQGKYRAEVPRLNEQIRDLQQQLGNAQKATAKAEQTAESAKAELTDVQARLREEVGEEAADAMSGYAEQLVDSRLKQYEQQQSQDAEQRFYATLRSRIPDFDSVNASPAFVQWLQTPDPSTGFPYQDTLNQAGQALDTFTVLDVFQQFKREQQPKPKAPNPTAPEQQVAAPKGTQRTPPQQKPSYTPRDFEVLQEQKRRGLWAGKDQEFRALEREIHAALTG